MANSMTGFGRFEAENEAGKVTVEIRTVNHRYLDLNLKINHRLLVFENSVRRTIKDRLSRGKVDVLISFEPTTGVGEDVVYNEALAMIYANRISKIANDFNLVNDLTATRLATLRDVLTIDETAVDENELGEIVDEALDHALSLLIEHRNDEGERLKADMINKLNSLADYVKRIEEKSPQIVEEYKAKLTEKVNGLLEDHEAEAGRIAMEVVLYADKICVDEEIVRLSSHIDAFKTALNSDGEVGRKLDFIAQEMNREANTILSKTSDPEISDIGIEIKTLIEKIREQVQNLE